ncbi:MAG: hypothetical protein ACREL4_09000 [Gemmatimonadales bacterium]
MARSLTLAAAIVSLALWVTFAFVLKVGSGAIHLLLALGVTLLVRWIALGNATGSEPRETV